MRRIYKNKAEKKVNLLIVIPTYSALIIALLTGFFYLHGLIYQQAYLEHFGVPVGLFNYRVEEVLSNGFLAFTIAGFGYYSYLTLGLLSPIFFIMLITILLEIPVINKMLNSVKHWHRKKNTQTNGNSETNLDKMFKKISNLSLIGGGILWVPFVLFFFIHITGEFGKEQAIKTYEKFVDSKVTSGNYSLKSEVVLSDIDLSGAYVFQCSEMFCAVLTDEGVEVIPAGSVEYISIRKKEPAVKVENL